MDYTLKYETWDYVFVKRKTKGNASRHWREGNFVTRFQKYWKQKPK